MERAVQKETASEAAADLNTCQYRSVSKGLCGQELSKVVSQ